MKQLLLLLLLAAGSAVAQNFTQVTATQLQDASGGKLPSGQLCVSGVSPAGQIIPFRAGGGGMVHSEPACTAVVNGGIGNNFYIANSTYTTPTNVAYVLTVTDNVSGQVVLTLGPTQISGTAFNIDTFTPNLANLALIQTGPTGATGATGAASVVTSNGSNGDYVIGGRMISKLGPEIDPLAYGVAADGATDDTTNFQAAVDAAAGKTLKATGSFKLGVVTLHSHSIYDFTNASISGTNASYIFTGTSVSQVEIIGGNFSTASFSPTITTPTGTYYSGVPITFTSSDHLKVHDQVVTDGWGAVNLTDSSYADIFGVRCLNGNACIAVRAQTVNMQSININGNEAPGGGDDGIFVGSGNPSGTLSISNVEISHNYADKTRLPSGATGSVGIRVGYYGGGVGRFSKFHVTDNVMKDMTQEGLYLFGLHDSVVANNTIDGYARVSGSTQSAFALGLSTATATDTDGVIVTGNKATGGVLTNYLGLAANWVANSTISNNQMIANFSGFGAFDCSNCSSNTVTGNKFSNTNGPSLHVYGAASLNHIHHNDLTVNTGGGASLSPTAGSLYNVVEHNLGDSLATEFYSTTAATDSKWWNLTPTADGHLFGNLMNDAKTAATTWLQVTRTGTTVNDVYLEGNTTSARAFVLTASPGYISSQGSASLVLAPGGTNAVVTSTSGGVAFPAIHSSTGTRYLCVDSAGNITASATACSGT